MQNNHVTVDMSIERAIDRSMKRHATVFSDVGSITEDEKSMVTKMARLKKYDPIRDILKSKSGFVNIVTRGGYQPLIEQIVLSAIPAGEGGIFNAGMEYTVPGDYDIDAARLGSPQEAVGKLSELFLGKYPPITPSVMEENGFTDAKSNKLFGKTQQVQSTDQFGGAGPASAPRDIWPIIKNFFERLDRLNAEIEDPSKNEFKRDMMEYYNQIVRATLERRKNKLAEEKNKKNEGVVGYVPVETTETLSEPDFQRLKKMFVNSRNQYLYQKSNAKAIVFNSMSSGTGAVPQDVMQQVMPIIENLLNGYMPGEEQNIFGKKQRVGGFLGRNKNSEIDRLWSESVEALQHTKSIAQRKLPEEVLAEAKDEEKKRLFALLEHLNSIKTIDPNTEALKQRIIDKFKIKKDINGKVSYETPRRSDDIDTKKVSSQIKEVFRDVKELSTSIKSSQDRFLIISNIDSSPLVRENPNPREDEDAYKILFSKVLDAFEVELSRGTGDQKTIILISKEPLGGLPYEGGKPNKKPYIDFSDYSVDAEEAKIIVDHITEAEYGTRFKSTWNLKMERGIEAKRNARLREIEIALRKDGNAEKAAAAKRQLQHEIAIEQGNIQAHVMGAYERSLPGPEQMKEAEIALVGLEQKQAINLVKECVVAAMSREYTQDGDVETLDSVGFDMEKWNDNIVKRGNRLHADSVPGLHKRRSRVAFKDYIFAQKSKTGDERELKWGQKVGEFGSTHQRMMEINKLVHEIITDSSGEQAAYQEIIDNPNSSAWERQQAELSLASIKGSRTELLEQKATLLGKLPHLVILYGKSGVGKTVWADALADLFGFSIMSVDLGSAKDKWLGNTEKFTDRIISVVKNSRNAVVLIDEMDRDVSGGGKQDGGAGSKTGGHQVDQAITKKLMALFEDDKDRLVENNVFVLITTNYVNDFDPALIARSENNLYEVVAPTDEKDYEKYMNSFLETEKKYMPNDPWLNSIQAKSPSKLSGVSTAETIENIAGIKGKYTMEDYWKEVESLIRGIPMDRFCQIMAQKRLSFRTVCSMMRRAVAQHALYELTKMRFQKGEITKVQGMPFTFENLVRAASLADDSNDDISKHTDGIGETTSELTSRANEAVEKMLAAGTMKKAPMITIVEGKPYTPEQVMNMINRKEVRLFRAGVVGMNWSNKVFKGEELIAIVQTDYAGNIVMGSFMPEEIDRMMVAELPKEEVSDEVFNPEFEVDEQIAGGRSFPSFKKKQPQQPPVGKTMEELVSDGIQQLPIEPETTEQPAEEAAKNVQKTKDNGKDKKKIAPNVGVPDATSTTDYYYNILLKTGILTKIAQYQQQMFPDSQQAVPVAPVGTQQPVPQQAVPQQLPPNCERYGVYLSKDRQKIIMPAGPDEKPYIISEQMEGQKL